jgi:hypothetical protein
MPQYSASNQLSSVGSESSLNTTRRLNTRGSASKKQGFRAYIDIPFQTIPIPKRKKRSGHQVAPKVAKSEDFKAKDTSIKRPVEEVRVKKTSNPLQQHLVGRVGRLGRMVKGLFSKRDRKVTSIVEEKEKKSNEEEEPAEKVSDDSLSDLRKTIFLIQKEAKLVQLENNQRDHTDMARKHRWQASALLKRAEKLAETDNKVEAGYLTANARASAVESRRHISKAMEAEAKRFDLEKRDLHDFQESNRGWLEKPALLSKARCGLALSSSVSSGEDDTRFREQVKREDTKRRLNDITYAQNIHCCGMLDLNDELECDIETSRSFERWINKQDRQNSFEDSHAESRETSTIDGERNTLLEIRVLPPESDNSDDDATECIVAKPHGKSMTYYTYGETATRERDDVSDVSDDSDDSDDSTVVIPQGGGSESMNFASPEARSLEIVIDPPAHSKHKIALPPHCLGTQQLLSCEAPPPTVSTRYSEFQFLLESDTFENSSKAEWRRKISVARRKVSLLSSVDDPKEIPTDSSFRAALSTRQEGIPPLHDIPTSYDE